MLVTASAYQAFLRVSANISRSFAVEDSVLLTLSAHHVDEKLVAFNDSFRILMLFKLFIDVTTNPEVVIFDASRP